jgi:hypothetical protein
LIGVVQIPDKTMAKKVINAGTQSSFPGFKKPTNWVFR